MSLGRLLNLVPSLHQKEYKFFINTNGTPLILISYYLPRHLPRVDPTIITVDVQESYPTTVTYLPDKLLYIISYIITSPGRIPYLNYRYKILNTVQLQVPQLKIQYIKRFQSQEIFKSKPDLSTHSKVFIPLSGDLFNYRSFQM